MTSNSRAVVSIVVPVYKTGPYLPKCVESIRTQTYSDLQILLVDDGSPDECPQLCEEYARQDSRIQVIHKKNGGVSSARNAGLEAASGTYLTFCDSDDACEPDWIENLVLAAEETRADVVVAGHQKCCGDGSRTPVIHETGTWELKNPDEKIRYCIDMVLTERHAWEITTRLFRRERIADVRFCETCGNFAEDLGFALACSFRTGRVTGISADGYLYNIRQDSMMGSSVNRPKLDSVNEVSLSVREDFRKAFPGDLEDRWYPILHFLIMMNQYSVAINLENYRSIGVYLDQIRRRQEWEAVTKQIFSCRDLLTELFGEISAGRILIYSRYCLHRCWFRFKVERFLFFKRKGYRD